MFADTTVVVGVTSDGTPITLTIPFAERLALVQKEEK